MAIFRGDDSVNRPNFVPGIVNVRFNTHLNSDRILEIVEAVSGNNLDNFNENGRKLTIYLKLGTDEDVVVAKLKEFPEVLIAEKESISYPA